MKKPWLIRLLLLIAYCVPFAFFVANSNTISGTILFYGVMIAAFALLCCGALKTNNIAILYIGNVLSFTLSFILATFMGVEAKATAFKPLKAYSLIVAISLALIVIQTIVVLVYFAKKRGSAESASKHCSRKKTIIAVASVVCVCVAVCAAGLIFQPKTYTEDTLIELARKELNIVDAEKAELTLAGIVTDKNEALVWFISGKNNNTYHVVECNIVGEGEYTFGRAFNAGVVERGQDIRVLVEWHNGYCFFVNNPECKTIKIEDYAGVKEIEVTEYPFVYYNSLLPGEYFFLNENGEEIR